MKTYIRESRAEFSLRVFARYFGDRVLDVGAGGSVAAFRESLSKRYVALDVSDSRHQPDVYANIELGGLPFRDNSFETVLCFDCLEHVETIHRLFDELIRLSRRYVILSLPNNWPGFLTDLFLGHNHSHTSGYGLPHEPPPLGQRHKWFFNLEEAEEFVRYRSSKLGAKVVEALDVYEPTAEYLIRVGRFYPRIFGLPAHRARERFGTAGYVLFRHGIVLAKLIAALEEVIKRLVFGTPRTVRYRNLFCRQWWCVLEKGP